MVSFLMLLSHTVNIMPEFHNAVLFCVSHNRFILFVGYFDAGSVGVGATVDHPNHK